MEDCSRNFSQMRRSLILCLEYEAHLKLTEREANQLQASIKRMMEILTNIIEIRSELATSRQSRLVKSKKIQEFSDSQASSFLDTLEYSWELLETFDHTATNNLVMMLRLSDVFLSFLIALEKYELISSRCLSDLLNRRNEGQVILNYIIGKFPWRKEEGMSVYLNLHMRQTVQASRLTRDVQPLLKHLTESSWTRIDYTYLVGQLTLKDDDEKFTDLVNQFRITALPFRTEFTKHMESVVTWIFHILEDIYQPSWNLIHRKFVYNMLHFIIDHHPEQISPHFVSAFKLPERDSAVDRFKKSIILLSSLENLRYENYIRMLRIASSDPRIEPEVVRRGVKRVYSTARYPLTFLNEDIQESSNIFPEVKFEPSIFDLEGKQAVPEIESQCQLYLNLTKSWISQENIIKHASLSIYNPQNGQPQRLPDFMMVEMWQTQDELMKSHRIQIRNILGNPHFQFKDLLKSSLILAEEYVFEGPTLLIKTNISKKSAKYDLWK